MTKKTNKKEVVQASKQATSENSELTSKLKEAVAIAKTKSVSQSVAEREAYQAKVKEFNTNLLSQALENSKKFSNEFQRALTKLDTKELNSKKLTAIKRNSAIEFAFNALKEVTTKSFHKSKHEVARILATQKADYSAFAYALISLCKANNEDYSLVDAKHDTNRYYRYAMRNVA